MLVSFNRGPVPPVSQDDDDDVLVLANEHLFLDRTKVDVGDGLLLDNITMDVLWTVQQEPYKYSHNLVLSSIDEAELELQKLMMEWKQVIVMDGTPLERCGGSRSKLEELLLSRFPNSNNLVVVVGATTTSETIVTDCLRGKTGFIGEIIIQSQLQLDSGVLNDVLRVLKEIREKNKSDGPPVMFSLNELHENKEGPRFVEVLELGKQIGNVFVQNGWSDRVILNGILESLPSEQLLDRVVLELLEPFDLKIGVGMPSQLLDFQNVILAVTYLCQKGYGDRLIISPNIRFKSQRQQYGGPGFSNSVRLFIEKLRNSNNVSEATIRAMLCSNASKVFSWWVPPEAPKPQKRPRWACDGVCGKTYSAKKEPFTRLGFKYCSLDCMNKHKDILDGDKKQDKDDRSGGGRRTANNSTSWGITVGT